MRLRRVLHARLMSVDYWQKLRAACGAETLITVGARVLVRQDRAVLLQRRRDGGDWGLPGGVKELGESLEETARLRSALGGSILRVELLRVEHVGSTAVEGMEAKPLKCHIVGLACLTSTHQRAMLQHNSFAPHSLTSVRIKVLYFLTDTTLLFPWHMTLTM